MTRNILFKPEKDVGFQDSGWDWLFLWLQPIHIQVQPAGTQTRVPQWESLLQLGAHQHHQHGGTITNMAGLRPQFKWPPLLHPFPLWHLLNSLSSLILVFQSERVLLGGFLWQLWVLHYPSSTWFSSQWHLQNPFSALCCNPNTAPGIRIWVRISSCWGEEAPVFWLPKRPRINCAQALCTKEQFFFLNQTPKLISHL